jgi:hypothetical protein
MGDVGKLPGRINSLVFTSGELEQMASKEPAQEDIVQIELDVLIAKLREVKQKEFNSAVEGNPREPAEVVDSVVWALSELTASCARRLYEEVLEFYPEYEM